VTTPRGGTAGPADNADLSPDDPEGWRPMRAATFPRRAPEIRDPIIEPLWSGLRVLVRVGPAEPRLRLTDLQGRDVTESAEPLAPAILAAIDAQDAIVDAVLTHDAARGGEGASIITQPKITMRSFLTHRGGDLEVAPRPADPGAPLALVAVDLLRVDGQPLIDLPLLERKRLLESVVRESGLVRVSVHVRPPVDPWVATWHGAGLKGAMLKAANSRYLPGSSSAEWRAVTRVAASR
jgi:bifunctional non-homologous end joining protein LigD